MLHLTTPYAVYLSSMFEHVAHSSVALYATEVRLWRTELRMLALRTAHISILDADRRVWFLKRTR